MAGSKRPTTPRTHLAGSHDHTRCGLSQGMVTTDIAGVTCKRCIRLIQEDSLGAGLPDDLVKLVKDEATKHIEHFNALLETAQGALAGWSECRAGVLSAMREAGIPFETEILLLEETLEAFVRYFTQKGLSS